MYILIEKKYNDKNKNIKYNKIRLLFKKFKILFLILYIVHVV